MLGLCMHFDMPHARLSSTTADRASTTAGITGDTLHDHMLVLHCSEHHAWCNDLGYRVACAVA